MAPQQILHYRVIRRLGAGGMAEVYLTQDTRLDRLVALKVMSAELARDATHRQRFRTEARAASGLSHPHICVIHEVGETEDGCPYLAMEYVEGHTLQEILQQRRMKIREIIKVGVEAAEALEAAHARGLVHRDIKPSNLMLDSRGSVKVMDFGLAKRFGPEQIGNALTSVAQTRTGMLIGTPEYMSPEQALGRSLDPRTDIFSLGVVLYEMAAGQRPFLGRTATEMINNIINQPAGPLGLDNPVFSPALDTIIFKCLEKDPEKRYASAKELASELSALRVTADQVLAATRELAAPTQVSPASYQRQPTALWRLTLGATRGRRARLAWGLGVATVLLLALAWWAPWRGGGSKPLKAGQGLTAVAQQKSVAVLPFINLSAEKSDEYLSDGMTEELLNALTKVKGLRVPGRSSSFAFKGKSAENIFRKVGEQLRVEAVLEGSVRKSGDKLRITAQLVNVADGFHLWSETYDRDMTNIFVIQSDIASRVAEALKVQLLGPAQEPTESIEAYTLYLQGRHLWNRRTGESLKQAVDCFNQAIAKDPRYALAYGGLAECYALLPIYDKALSAEAQAKTRQAALKALEFNPRLAAPYAALAALKDGYEWDWQGAEADYRRAIELDPNYPTARQWFAESLSMRGQCEEALQQAQRAVELDPLSPMINAILGRLLLTAGQPRESSALLRKQVGADPSFAPARIYLGWAYVSQGDLAGAITQYEAVRTLYDNHPPGELGFCYAKTGRTEEAKQILAHFLELQRGGKDLSVEIALVYHGLGKEQDAFAALEQAASEHSSQLQTIIENPCWKDAHADPGFRAILKKMNLSK